MYRCRGTACHMEKSHQLPLAIPRPMPLERLVRMAAIRDSWVSKRVGRRLSEAARREFENRGWHRRVDGGW